MYKRFYSGYDENQSEVGGALALPQTCENDDICVTEKGDNADEKNEIAAHGGNGEKILGPLAVDDLLLIGVLLLLLQQDSDDKLMIIIVGFILISGFLV